MTGYKNGCITPQVIADYLKSHGHLEGICDNRRYYSFNGKGYQVIMIDGKAVQVIEMPEADCKIIGACSTLKFGGF